MVHIQPITNYFHIDYLRPVVGNPAGDRPPSPRCAIWSLQDIGFFTACICWKVWQTIWGRSSRLEQYEMFSVAAKIFESLTKPWLRKSGIYSTGQIMTSFYEIAIFFNINERFVFSNILNGTTPTRLTCPIWCNKLLDWVLSLVGFASNHFIRVKTWNCSWFVQHCRWGQSRNTRDCHLSLETSPANLAAGHV